MNKKTAAISIGAIIIGLIIGIYLFFPWTKAAELAYYSAAERAAQSGLYVTVNSIESGGLLSKELVYSGISAESSLVRVNVSEVRVKPKLFPLLVGEKSVRLEIGTGTIVPMTGESIGWTSGSADLSMQGGELSVADLLLEGDISASGNAVVEASGGAPRLKDTDLLIKVPETYDSLLSLVQMTKIVPLEKTGGGEWRIRR